MGKCVVPWCLMVCSRASTATREGGRHISSSVSRGIWNKRDIESSLYRLWYLPRLSGIHTLSWLLQSCPLQDVSHLPLI